jgi:hypothetical protein
MTGLSNSNHHSKNLQSRELITMKGAMNSLDPLEQQKEYLMQRAAYITSFAQNQHAHQGRGIVVIRWPAPTFLSSEELLDSTNYVPEEALALSDLDQADDLVRAIRKYNPTWQALIMCIETMRKSFNVHILTAFHPEPKYPTEH